MGGGGAHTAPRQTLPRQQSALDPHPSPLGTQEPPDGTGLQCRTGGAVTGVSNLQTAEGSDPVPPQQSSSTSQRDASFEPVGRQASSAQNARSLTWPLWRTEP